MCFDVDSEPPVPRISGAAVSHDDLVLESADGNRFAAFQALPEGDLSTGVVILPDVRGLYRFYEELALRFAERGHAAIAFDYFGRTAGVEKRPNDWDFWPLVEQLTPEQAMADTGTCIRHLLEHGCAAVFTVGFCMGGSYSWLAAAKFGELRGAIGFYGRPFKSKDEVLEAVFHENWSVLLERIASVEETDEPAADQLRHITTIVLRTWLHLPDVVRVVIREFGRSPELEERLGELTQPIDAIQRVIERGIERGEFRKDIDPRFAAAVVYGSIDELLTAWVLGRLPAGEEDVAAAEKTLLEVSLLGLQER